MGYKADRPVPDHDISTKVFLAAPAVVKADGFVNMFKEKVGYNCNGLQVTVHLSHEMLDPEQTARVTVSECCCHFLLVLEK